MAFSSWAAFKTAVKDALQDYVEGKPAMQSFRIGSRQYEAKSVDEFRKLLELADVMDAQESAGDRSTMVSYGQLQ